MGSDHYCLRWNNHQNNLLGVFGQLLRDESLVDVTLACSEGHSIRAHKVVLSACSSYFQTLFLDHPSRHPIVILKDVRFNELRTLVEFMYKGEVNVEYCQLSALLKTAESLKVKGLAEMTREYKSEPEQTEPKELVNRRRINMAAPTTPPPQSVAIPVSPLTTSSVVVAAPPYLSPHETERIASSPSPPIENPNSSPLAVNFHVAKSPPPEKDSQIIREIKRPPSEVDNCSPPPPSGDGSDNVVGNTPPVICSRISSPLNCEPMPGPSSMPPVQQVPLSLKKEVEWSMDDKNSGESSSEYLPRHESELESSSASASAAIDQGGSPRMYPCMYCGNTFPHQSKLTRHILSHSLETLKYREQRHLASNAGLPENIFMDLSSRLPTTATHEPPDPTDQPPTAPNTTTTPMELDLNEAAASGAGGVVLCKFCGKSFPDVSSLIAHLPVHTGDRPFKCEFCGKAFKLRHHMKDHCRVHTGERPFRCALCGKTFSRSTILKAHEKTHYPKYVRKFLSPSPLDTEEESPH